MNQAKAIRSEDANAGTRRAARLETEIEVILAGEEELLPSSGFVASVMDQGRQEAELPAPIPFPWKRATAGIVLATGVCVLQTSANPYVSILGPEDTAPIRLTLAQALNSIGGTIAPLVAGAYILTDLGENPTKAAIANTVRAPYIFIAGGLLILGLAVAFSHLPPVAETKAFRPGKEGDDLLSRSNPFAKLLSKGNCKFVFLL